MTQTQEKQGFFDRILGRKTNGGPDHAQLLEQLLAEKLVHPVFQPLVDLKTRKTFAFEALCRSTVEEFRAPPVLFEAAVEHGRVGELGRLLRTMATEECNSYPLFLNVHPNEFEEGWLIRPDDPIFWHSDGVYLEVTESVPLRYFDQCHSVLKEARSKGVRLAVDDLGAGYSNLKYISDLTPEIVKLDRELVAGLSQGTRLFKLVKNIVRLCEDMGARVVAEGIETKQELNAVIDAGAHYGQGYLLAKPSRPPPEVDWPK